MIEISESKLDKMACYVEEMLQAGGRLMSCLEELEHGSNMGFRGNSGNGMGYRGTEEGYNRYGMGNRGNMGGGYAMRGGMGYREDGWENEGMDERRRRY